MKGFVLSAAISIFLFRLFDGFPLPTCTFLFFLEAASSFALSAGTRGGIYSLSFVPSFFLSSLLPPQCSSWWLVLGRERSA